MKKCFYYKNGEKINDMRDLIHDFFKDTMQLKNTAIFSAEDIQKSIRDRILKLPGATTFKDSDYKSITTFISEQNEGLFNKLGIKTKAGRLNPEYIKENRIYQFIYDNLKKVAQLPEGADVSKLSYSEEMFKAMKARPELSSISNVKIITLLSEIEDIMNFEELTKDFGNFLHKIVALKTREFIDDAAISRQIKGFLNDPSNAAIVGDASKEDWFIKIHDIANEIVSKVQKNGILISEIFILSEDNSPINTALTKFAEGKKQGIKGKLDLVAIDKDGAIHIFELKISKTSYDKWDTAKKSTLDWQLALYRQLLGQYFDVNQTMLYVIPVLMQGVGNPSAVSVQTLANRKTESHSGLNNGGELSRKADLIIKRGVVADYDPERIIKLNSQLAALMPEDYEIRTGIEDYSVEKIMESARKRYEKDKVWKKWNNFDDIQNLDRGYMEGTTEEEFRAKIEIYVSHIKGLVNKNVSILKDAIISSIKTNSPIKTSTHDRNRDITTNHLLKEYLNDEWIVVDSFPEALAMGLIVLKNSHTGNVNIISLSVNQFYADSTLKDKNYGDLEIMKSFLFLNMFKDQLFPLDSGKVGTIIVFNPANNQVYSRYSFSKFEEFKEEMYRAKLQDELKLTDKHISAVFDTAIYNLDVNLRKFNGSPDDKKVLNELFPDTNLANLDLNSLLELQKGFYDKYDDYKNRTMKEGINFEDPKEIILALLQVAIITKQQMELYGDFQGLSTLSLGFSDFKSLVSIFYTDNVAKYNKEGKRIQGILQGLWWTTPDQVASKDLRSINNIMSTGNQHVGEGMVKVSEVIFKHTKEFYKAQNFGNLERNSVGETQSKYKNLWKQTKDNKVADDFMTKNPYLEDLDNALEDHERKYLKEILFIINRWNLELSDEEAAKIDPSTLESISKNPKIKEAIESGKYFRMPLVRREEITRYKNAFSPNGKLWQDRIKPYMQEINDYLDGRELLASDLKILENQKLGFYEMFDVYGRHTPEYVARGIEKHTVDYFEWNLDTIAHRVSFNKIRKRVFDKRLPIINAYVWWMKLTAAKENEDISKQLQYVSDQMSLSIYDEPIIDSEAKDYATTAAVVKQLSTAAMLAFKPVSFLKEMTIGAFKGITLAATQIYGKDQFNVGDLFEAYKKLATIDHKFSTEFNLIDRLNHFYRFANMDTNTIAKKLQTDRHGVLKGFSRYMYMCNTIPDYYNRLSIFLAKMIHDGSYEAHTLVDGEFKYDARKDKRFSYYLSERNKHLKNGEYQPSTTDKEYNIQRRKYLLLITQLNTEYNGEQVFTEESLVPKAYSEIERSSLKSFTDMAYGYYDKDAQSQANNMWWGMTWLQFMQFWPGKMKMWFANPTGPSPMGKVGHEFLTVEGKKIYQYWKIVEDENGNLIQEKTEEDTGDPVMQWLGTPPEGLFYSLIGTIRDITLLRFDKIKNSEDRNRRAIFALGDAGIMFLLLAIAHAILKGMIAENGTDGVDGKLLALTETVNRKVLNEYNIWNSTFGAPQSEPVYLSWSKKVTGDIWDALQGDKEMMDVMTRNFGAAEVFKF